MSENSPAPIFILSGGIGASGEQLVNTVLAQFPDGRIPVTIIGNLRTPEQVTKALRKAARLNAIVVHTLVEHGLREVLLEQAAGLGLSAFDLMGPLIEELETRLGRPALARPGLYRQHHQAYFARVAAIEYSMTHDDGMHPEGWPEADLLLVGVSRSGKTPLSIYLSVLGWKVANLPLVPEVAVPVELFDLDPRRVIGLTIDPDRLLYIRRQRTAHLGLPGPGDAQAASAYADPQGIAEEIQYALRVCRKGGFRVLNVTDKTIEASADEILKIIGG